MANNLTLSVTLTGDGRQLSGTLKDAQGDVREFSATTERESKKAETALTAPGRQAGTVSEHLRDAGQEARTFGTEADQGGRQASQALAQTGAQAQTVSSHLNRLRSVALGVVMALVSMAGGLSFGSIISQTADFEDSILGLQAVSSATVGEIAQLEQQARSLGATSMHSAKQSADAQRFLAQAGFDVNEVLAATPSVLNLATAGQMDLAQAADIASNVLGGMRMEVDQLNRVNDVMAATSARSNTNIMQLGEAFSYAGPFAASAGISIETTSAAIGVLSDAGLQASRAGTGLIGIIRQLSNVTPQAAGVLANYGLTIEDVNIEAHGLETVLERIRDANVSTADAFAIFGSEAGAAAQILAAGAGRVREFSGELNSVEGEVERMALIIGSGLTGSIRGFNSMLSESILQLGESGVSGAFGLVVDNATGVLAVYNDMLPALAEANDLTDEQIARIEALAGGIDLLGDALIITGGIMAGRYVGAIAASQAALTAKATVAAATTGTLNLLTGATTRQAAAATAMAGATRVATGALALVGGPLGAAVIAAGAIYYFRDSLNGTAEQARQTAQRVDELTNSINTNSEAAVKAQLVSLTAQMFDLERQAIAARAEVERVTSGNGTSRSSGALGIGAGQTTAQATAIQQLGQIANEMEAVGQSSDRLRGILGQLQSDGVKPLASEFRTLDQWLLTTTQTTGESTEADIKSADAKQELTKATEAQATALEALRNRLIPGRREVVQLSRDMQTLTLAIAMGTGNIGQNIQMMGLLQQQYIDAQKDTEDLADQTVKAAFTMEGAWDEVRLNGLRRLDDGFANLWESAIDGSMNAADTMKRVLNKTLAELAHMAITRPITVQIATSMGFGGGAGGMGGMGGAGAGGGFGINPGSINNAWQSVQGGFNGVQWGGAGGAQSYGGTGWANAATSGTGSTGLWGGSMQNYQGMQGMYSAGAGIAGNYVGGEMFGKGEHSDILGTLGGVVGTYFGGPIGAFIGSTLGSAVGGLFGGRSWNETGSGVNLGVSGGNITGNQFSEQYSKGGWFRSSKRRTQTSALDGEFSSALQDVYDVTEQSLAATIEVLGFQSSALAGFTTGLTRIDTKGLSAEDAEAKIQEWLSNTLNALAIHSVGDVSQYAFSGETTIDTLERLATVLSGINPILEQLHGNTLAASLAGGDAAAHLAALAGGIDAFSARADYYYQNVLTESERQERAMNAAAQAVGAFTARTGQVINSTDALRDLVDGIDLTTASGRELYNEAMNLAPALVEIERGLERVGQQFNQMLEDASAAVSDAEAQVRRAYQVFDGQQFDMQLELLALMGDAEGALALERERELASIDESLRPMRERIWAMQDEITVQQNATTAARNYQRELSRVRDQLTQQFANIGNWLDQQQATSGSPETNLATAQEQLARQLVLIENGDRNALQGITQYADRVLEANRAFNASSEAGQRIQEDVYAAIRALPESITAEQFLADEIRKALQEAVEQLPGGIASSLHPLFDSIDLDASGLIDWNEFYGAFQGLASDDELKRIFQQLDKDGSGTISRLEALNRTSQGTETNTDSLEKQARDQLRELSGLVSEMARSTDQFVSLNSTMVSLRESINALGVAQEEVARIERERVAAEQRARERVELSRQIGEVETTVAGHLAEADYRMGRRAFFMDATKEHSGNVSAGVEDRVLNYIHENTSRSDMTAAEREQMHSWMLRVFGDGSPEYLYALSRMGSFRNESLARDAQRQADQSAQLLEQLRGQLAVNGSHRTGLEYVPFDGYVAELHRGEKVLTAEDADAMRNVSTSRFMFSQTPLPSFPLLGNNDVVETLRDLKREVAELRRDNARLQGESNKHLAAANNQRGAAAKGQINAIERSNKMLKRMEDDKRLEAAKR
ncbi:phage tail tape measure protein [Halomonas sp. 86]|uniref:phage tail tape measure protein n=1 Tax=unclassified Halomonas TaxID=2609666 RepID=UPI004033FEEF